MSIELGDWDEYCIYLCSIHASFILEIGRSYVQWQVRTFVQWRVGLLSSDELGLRSCDELDDSVTHLWISKFLYHIHWSRGDEYIAYIIAFVNDYCFGWIVWLIIYANCITFTLSHTVDICECIPILCLFLCCSLRMWCRYSGRDWGVLVAACIGGSHSWHSSLFIFWCYLDFRVSLW